MLPFRLSRMFTHNLIPAAALVVLLTVFGGLDASAAPPVKAPTEHDYYRMVTFPLPKEAVLEVGGMDWLDKKKQRLLVCTRRGELWVVDNAYADKPVLAGTTQQVKGKDGKSVEVKADPKLVYHLKRMLLGLHEPLGMMVNPGHGYPDGIYMAQRGELTRVVDKNGDDRIDLVETFNNQWEISGSYHEYAFGPKMGKDGRLWVTLNRPFGGGQEGTAYWRGWAITVDAKGKMKPVCPGLRSPAGLGANAEGEMFYTDNQGDHVAVCKLSHLKQGVFHGQPVGLQSCDHPLATFKRPSKSYPKLGIPWGEAVKANPRLQPPAVWFPYPIMGRSHSDVQCDESGGRFGPFTKQLFVGDQGNAIIVRVFLEKIGGEYQGACFPFRRGFQLGVLRMCWGKDGSMFVGGTNRGWGGGSRPYCLQRIVWTGKVPFEIHEMRARPDGFLLTFTAPVDSKTAADVKSYSMRSWTYNYHSAYGDKQRDESNLTIESATPGADGRSVHLKIKGLKPHYVHALRAAGVRSKSELTLLHADAYYTLSRIPKK